MRYYKFSSPASLPVLMLSLLAAAWLSTGQPHLYAQRPLDLDEIRVVAPFEPSISDANKIYDNPRIDDIPAIEPDFVFRFTAIPHEVSFTPEAIVPARIREPLGILTRGMIRGGYGNYGTPFGEAFYNSLRSNSHAYGIHLRHLSSSGGIEDRAYSGFSENSARLFGTRFFNRHSLNASIGYDRQVLHHYGFINDSVPLEPGTWPHPILIDFPDRADIRQRYETASAQLSWGKKAPSAGMSQYNTGLSYRFHRDRFEALEHHASFNGQLVIPIAEDPFHFTDEQYFRLDGGGEWYMNQNLSDTLHAGIIRLSPAFHARAGRFTAHLGVEANVELDSLANFRAYPMAGIEAEIVPERLSAYASLSGGLKRHSLYSLSTQNPFIQTSLPHRFERTRSDIRLGMRGALSTVISYQFEISSARIDNHVFFVNDWTEFPGNRFMSVYDNISRLGFHTELMGTLGERFQLRLAASWYDYTTDDLAEAWHMPRLEATANMRYDIRQKIIFTADIFARDRLLAPWLSPAMAIQPVEISGFHLDANIGIEYRVNRLISVFGRFYNVTNQSVERWMNYPSQGIQFMGGAAWSF